METKTRRTSTRLVSTAFAAAAAGGGALLSGGCNLTDQPVRSADIGTVRTSSEMGALMTEPGPIEVETIAAADWVVDRSGLINLDHPEAERAGLQDAEEPIQIYFHALRHPEHGLFIVDTGVERALYADPDHAAIQGWVADYMNVERMKIHVDTATWLAGQSEPLSGVFLTHMHLDHVSGLQDVPRGTPIYAGPGETEDRKFTNLFVSPTIDRAFAGHDPVQTWQFGGDRDGQFDGIVDVFGDRSLFAIWVPGHTPGSTAYLARTPRGPVLMVGDASHTAWGWKHGVEPGEFSSDLERSADSLRRLIEFTRTHPNVDVRLGHQPLPTATARL